MTTTDDMLPDLPEGLLAELERAGHVVAPADQLLLDTRAALRRAATTETLRADVRRARRRRRLAGRALVGVASVAVVLASLGIVGTEGHTPVPPAAAGVLSTAAERLTAVPMPGPGDYLHVRTVLTSMDADGTAPRIDVDQTWVPADDDSPGLDRSTADDGTPFPDGLLLPRSRPSRDGDPVTALYLEHPSDPGAMLAALRRLSSASGDREASDDVEVWETAVSLVLDNQAPLDLKSDVLRAVAHLPGVAVVDRSVRVADRTGTAIGLSDDRHTPWLVFDHGSQTYLGVVGHPARGPGWVGPEEPSWTAVTTYSVSDAAPWTRETAAQARSYGLDVRVPSRDRGR